MLTALMIAVTLMLMLVLGPGEQAAAQGGTCTENTSCSSAEYCATEEGRCDGSGTCTARPATCPPAPAPVCGCDGKTYTNACAAATAGVSVDYTGPCLGVAIDPPSQTVEVGQLVTVDLLITGLDATGEPEIVSAFDLEVRYDPAILELTGVTFGPGLSTGTVASLQDYASTPGVIDLAEVSFLTDAELAATQPGSFILATLAFTVKAKGISALTFVFDHVNDVKGVEAQMLMVEARNGSVTAALPTLTVRIDIKPGSFPNSINPRAKGVIPVAILTTAKATGEPLDFDATTVDPLSVKFGPQGATEVHRRGHVEDVDRDGDQDLLLHFDTQATGIPCGATLASLTGKVVNGQDIAGADSVNTVGCKK